MKKCKPPPKATGPFRLMDLPMEIRCMIYKELFPTDIRLDLEQPNCSCGEHLHKYRTNNLKHPPGALLAFKELRTECLPLYLSRLQPVTYDVFPNDTLAKIPARYLTEVKTITIDEETAQLPDTNILPALETVIIHQCWDTEYSDIVTADRDASLEDVLDNIMEAYSKKNICYFIEEAKLQSRPPPYKILLETQVLLTCEHDHCDVLWLSDILVDIDARKILECDNALQIGHETECPALAGEDKSESDEGENAEAEDDEGNEEPEDEEVATGDGEAGEQPAADAGGETGAMAGTTLADGQA